MKKIALIVMTFVLLTCLFVSCAPKTPAETISYSVYAPDGAPALAIAKMMKDGENVAENRAFTYNILGGSNQADLIKSTITNKEADFIIAPTNLGVKLALVQKQYVLAATTSWGNLCIVTNDALVKTLEESENINAFMAQFSGQTVASIGTGAVPDVSFKYLLAQNEITDCEVTAADLQKIQTDLNAGNIKFGIVGEPAATATVKTVQDTRILCNLSDVWSQTVGTDFPQASLFVKKSVIENDKETVDAFLTKLKASIEYLNASADNALEMGTYMENSGKSSLKGAIVKASYVGMKQNYVSAQESKASVIRFVNVLGVECDEQTSADVFYK